MKLIYAYIQPHKLSEVSLALRPICGFSVVDVRGRGRGKLATEKEHPSAVDFEKHVKIEVCSPDDTADLVIEAIRKAAHTGLTGDGLICVGPLEDVLRVSSGKHGDEAC